VAATSGNKEIQKDRDQVLETLKPEELKQGLELSEKISQKLMTKQFNVKF
jgi:hypothetical protein